MFQVSYRKGHAGVASGYDDDTEVEADSVEEICQDHNIDSHFLQKTGSGWLYEYPDNSGRWEHTLTIDPVDNDEENCPDLPVFWPPKMAAIENLVEELGL